MKRAILAGLFLFLSTVAVFAQQPDAPATKEEVQKLFDVLHTRENFSAVMNSMKQQMPQMVSTVMQEQLPNATAEQKAEMDKFVTGMYSRMFSSMPIDEILSSMIPVYQRNLTHSDIEATTAFYSSPAGQKFITQMPKIMSEAMQAEMPILQKWMAGEMDEVKKSVEDYARSLSEKDRAAKSPAKKKS